MAFDELEQDREEREVVAFVERKRPPPDVRPQLDIGFRIRRQSVEIFVIRPEWRQPEQKRESPVAKATYVRRQDFWRICWMRSDFIAHRNRNAVLPCVRPH